MVTEEIIRKEELNMLNWAVKIKCEKCEDYVVATFLEEDEAKRFAKRYKDIYYVTNLENE